MATTLGHARQVLTNPDAFDFPSDVSRRPLGRDEAEGSSRSPHVITPPLDATAVARGRDVFARELEAVTGDLDAGRDVDAMTLLRDPVARSTVAAVLPDLDVPSRDLVGTLVLDWIDALGPVIARARPPHRWSRTRRREDAARAALEHQLTRTGLASPALTATVLAAGIQVPIAAGAWLLVALAHEPRVADRLRERRELAAAAAWETVRLYSPTWITARIATADVRLGSSLIPAGDLVMVSPLLLGRLDALVPGAGEGHPLDHFDPVRWDQEQVRPGAWLPFGAGPHACPGRNLGLAQLTHLATWAGRWRLTLLAPVSVDQSRGIFPRPAQLRFDPC